MKATIRGHTRLPEGHEEVHRFASNCTTEVQRRLSANLFSCVLLVSWSHIYKMATH
ncbi:hypothetical protein [Caballeronia concitans]|uniref:hypothetical protein n=1 Tax=Caballeronia concitans TaxID=1777133 RepID=UPI000A84DED6|nr:hypothetical protein [Caballeronia concitans]